MSKIEIINIGAEYYCFVENSGKFDIYNVDERFYIAYSDYWKNGRKEGDKSELLKLLTGYKLTKEQGQAYYDFLWYKHTGRPPMPGFFRTLTPNDMELKRYSKREREIIQRLKDFRGYLSKEEYQSVLNNTLDFYKGKKEKAEKAPQYIGKTNFLAEIDCWIELLNPTLANALKTAKKKTPKSIHDYFSDEMLKTIVGCLEKAQLVKNGEIIETTKNIVTNVKVLALVLFSHGYCTEKIKPSHLHFFKAIITNVPKGADSFNSAKSINVDIETSEKALYNKYCNALSKITR